MSKTTIFLFIILLIFIGVLLYIMYGSKQNSIITTFTKPIISRFEPARTTLSLTSNEPTATPGQRITIAVLIHNPNPHPDIAQLELGYNPSELTIDSITPGTFFTSPTVALDTIDPVAGRISYALRCPDLGVQNAQDCANVSSSTLATITVTINPYLLQNIATLSFLPKTVIRISNGRDLLQKTSDLQIALAKPFTPVASSSGITIPAGNLIHGTPVH